MLLMLTTSEVRYVNLPQTISNYLNDSPSSMEEHRDPWALSLEMDEDDELHAIVVVSEALITRVRVMIVPVFRR